MQRVFIDESGTTDGKYLVIGSLWGHDSALTELGEALERVIVEHFPNRRELKWVKVSATKFAGYTGVADAFANTLGIRFRCIVIDRSKLDHDRFNSGDADLGYYKFVYQLLCKGIQKDRQLFGVQDRYLLFHDTVSSTLRQTTRLSDLKRILNNTSSLVTDIHSFNPVRDVQSLDSKSSVMMQLTDVLTGAVRNASDNRGNYSGSAPAKKNLIAHLQSRVGLSDISNQTTYGFEKFNIWHFKTK